MGCGPNDVACQLLSLLASHGAEMANWVPWLEGRVRENIQAIIGLAGFSFGVWKWWYFREKVLHQRLKEYLRDQDERLRHARSDALQALHRPGTTRSFAEPLFAVGPLRKILRRRGWERWTGERRPAPG